MDARVKPAHDVERVISITRELECVTRDAGGADRWATHSVPADDVHRSALMDRGRWSLGLLRGLARKAPRDGEMRLVSGTSGPYAGVRLRWLK